MRATILCYYQTNDGREELIQRDLTTTKGYYRRMCKMNTNRSNPFTRLDFYYDSFHLYGGIPFKSFVA